MRRRVVALLLALTMMPAVAQHEGHPPESASPQPPVHEHGADDPPQPPPSTVDPHAAHRPGAASAPNRGVESPPPPAASSGPVYAADTEFDPDAMAAARERLHAEHGGGRAQLFLVDRFEAVSAGGAEHYAWDMQGWHGGDVHKLWLKSEGRGATGDNPQAAEMQTLYSRAATPFFDFQVGIRHDFRPSPERSHLVLGMQGLLPGTFDVDGALFLSDENDITGRVEVEHGLRITQRLVLQPRVELEFAAQSVPELGIGSGLGSIEGGWRLRYEIRRELAPYAGVFWERKLGETGDIARAAGNERRSVGVVVGVRGWF